MSLTHEKIKSLFETFIKDAGIEKNGPHKIIAYCPRHHTVHTFDTDKDNQCMIAWLKLNKKL